MTSAVKLNSIDIVATAMIAVSRTMSSMLSIELSEMPTVNKQNFTTVVLMPEGTYLSFVALTQDYKGKKVKGGILVQISKSNLSVLFGSLGINDMSGTTEVNDACGEFCNVIAGAFKTGIDHIGYEDVCLTIPEHSPDSVVNWFGYSANGQKHRLSFSHNGKGILLVDVYMAE